MKLEISLTILVTLMIVNTEAVEAQNQRLIETTCKNTPNDKLCTAILRATPGSGGADLPELGLIMVGEVKKKSTEALVIISKLMAKSGGQRKKMVALRQCREVYKAVVDGDIAVARQAIRGDPKFAETAMADAAVEAQTCEEALEEVGSTSPLTAVNKYVADVSALARAIIRNLL